MKKIIPVILPLVLSAFLLPAQTTSKTKSFIVDNKVVITARSLPGEINPEIAKRVLPKPHAGVDQATIDAAKQALNRYRQSSGKSNASNRIQNADPPLMMRNFIANAFNGYVPNDNDLALSNAEQVCSVSNTTIWSRDLVTNTTYGSFNLHTLTSSLGLQQEEFDPKVLYDPNENRFIMVCLNGFTDTTSNILVGFSQDSTSHNNWNFYALAGNPLNNNLWTDFPMMCVTDDELFITVNLLYNDSTWQAGFNQTVIWQINKNEGYTGATLNPLLHFDIKHNNQPLRNLCPAKGGSTLYGPNQYFLSDRNFTVDNDTIFLVEVSGTITQSPTVTVTPLESNLGYRMPVNALQPSADSLIVNDARILGAYYENDMIQFVLNTTDTATGQVCIYHGVIDALSGTPALTAALYVNDSLDLAYPNIAYAGTSSTDNRAVISVLMSSQSIFPGTSAFKYDGNGVYSTLTTVKTGLSYTNMLAGNERWGDYTGCQTRYNIPGHVWVNGSYSLANHTTRTWIGELTVTSGVSVPEISQSKEVVKVYPNPAEERISIDFNKPTDGSIVITLYDAQGKKIKQLYKGGITSGENSFSFNIISLSPGSYQVVISEDVGKIITTKQFIKN